MFFYIQPLKDKYSQRAECSVDNSGIMLSFTQLLHHLAYFPLYILHFFHTCSMAEALSSLEKYHCKFLPQFVVVTYLCPERYEAILQQHSLCTRISVQVFLFYLSKYPNLVGYSSESSFSLLSAVCS